MTNYFDNIEAELERSEWDGKCPSCKTPGPQMYCHGDGGSGFDPACPPEIGAWSSNYYECRSCGKRCVVLSDGARRQREQFAALKAGQS